MRSVSWGRLGLLLGVEFSSALRCSDGVRRRGSATGWSARARFSGLVSLAASSPEDTSGPAGSLPQNRGLLPLPVPRAAPPPSPDRKRGRSDQPPTTKTVRSAKRGGGERTEQRTGDGDDGGGWVRSATVLRVQNLDWTSMSPASCECYIRAQLFPQGGKGASADGCCAIANVTVVGVPGAGAPGRVRVRDAGKLHGGSALVAFNSPRDANAAHRRYLRMRDGVGAGDADVLRRSGPDSTSPVRVCWLMERVRAPAPAGPSPEEKEAVRARREARAEEYSNRRKKRQQLVDSILLKIAAADAAGDADNGVGSGKQDPPPPVTTTLLGNNMRVGVDVKGAVGKLPRDLRGEETLVAPALDWDGDEAPVRNDDGAHGTRPWGVPVPEAVDPARGGGLRGGRADRKKAAAEAFVHAVRQGLLADAAAPGGDGDDAVVADLGSGAGNLAVPLAYFCADLCAVLAVDVNGVSLARLRERAKRADIAAVCGGKAPALGGGGAIATLQCDLLDLVDGDAAVGPDGAGGQKNTCFDAIVSLHACGAASDLAILAAIELGVPFAVSPCCIGKVNVPRKILTQRNDEKGESGQNMAKRKVLSSSQRSMPRTKDGVSITYPRSEWLRRTISPEEYVTLAKAADYGPPDINRPVAGETGAADTEDGARRLVRGRRAKNVVECDRLEFAREMGYYVRILSLPRIGPKYPKREILFGAKVGSRAARSIGLLESVNLIG